MKQGEWYELPDQSIARVVEVSGTPEMVLAEGARGGVVERPLANARIRWRRIPEDGLAVRFATAPEAIHELARNDPVGLIVLAIKDLGGTATTTEIKARLRLALEEEGLVQWWKRNQTKLSKDDRIDNVDALSKRYRLAMPGLGRAQRTRDIRPGITVAGRERLDGPVLKSSRERAKRHRDDGEGLPDDLMDIAALVDDQAIDPTDRFMAGEIGVFLGAYTEAQLAERLGRDVCELDLLRVPDHKSRDRAIGLCERSLAGREETAPAQLWPTLASAIALGDTWGQRAVGLALSNGFERRVAISAGLRWAAPGSPEAGEVDHPRDLQRYLARTSRIASSLEGLGTPAGVEQQSIDALAAMAALSSLGRRDEPWRDCMTALVELLWDVPTSALDAVRGALGTHPPGDEEVWQAIMNQAPEADLARLESLLESVITRSPASLKALETFARRHDRDVAAWLVRIARKELRDSAASRVILQAIDQAPAAPVSHSDSVTLGGTTWPDHPLVSSALDRMEKEAQTSLVTGDVTVSGPVLLRRDAWPRIVASVRGVVEEALAERDAAIAAREDLQERLATQSAQLEGRRAALQAAKTQQTQVGSASAQRLALNLLKPFAGALDDSYESSSLNGLQDQLRAALGRLRVRPLAMPGDVVRFDPDRHTWTGAGYPPPEVRALTPGFVAQSEGGDEVVVTFARVGPVEDQAG